MTVAFQQYLHSIINIFQQIFIHLNFQFGGHFNEDILEQREFLVDKLTYFGHFCLLLSNYALKSQNSLLSLFVLILQSVVVLDRCRFYGIFVLNICLFFILFKLNYISQLSQLICLSFQLYFSPFNFFILLADKLLLSLDKFSFFFQRNILFLSLFIDDLLTYLYFLINNAFQLFFRLTFSQHFLFQLLILQLLLFELVFQTAVLISQMEAFLQELDISCIIMSIIFLNLIGGRLLIVKKIVQIYPWTMSPPIGSSVGIYLFVLFFIRGNLQQLLGSVLQLFQILSTHNIIRIQIYGLFNWNDKNGKLL